MASKQIGELTLEEITKICKKHCNDDGNSCYACPLNNKVCKSCGRVACMGIINCPKYLDEKVEIGYGK